MSQKLHHHLIQAEAGFFLVPVDGVLDEKEKEEKEGGEDPRKARFDLNHGCRDRRRGALPQRGRRATRQVDKARG